MFSKSMVAFVALALLSSTEPVMGRIRWLERDDHAILLHPRRFGQENPPVIAKLGAACPGEVCGNLSGAAITPLLAAQGECTQQDMADQIIDAAAQFDEATKANMIALAIEYRQAEKNTPPDFTTNPPANRNSVFCQKAPKNPELNGLVQAQDPANDPNLFFDPATKATVTLGSQANTAPFGGAATAPPVAEDPTTDDPADDEDPDAEVPADDDTALPPCTVQVTVTVSAAAEATASDAVSVSVPADATSTAAVPVATGGANIGDFGSCSVPSIDFAAGFDNRRETAFQPTDLTSYPHGSAQAIGIITRFICDTLVNSCKADDTAKATCATATEAANGGAAKTGEQADLFNAVFGITTNFAAVQSIDDQGRPIAGTGNGGGAAPSATAIAPEPVVTEAPDAGTEDPATEVPAEAATSTVADVPAVTEAPAPVETEAPVPVETEAPAPVETEDPAPVETETPAPAPEAPAGGNLQTFTEALGGVTAPAVTALADGKFQVAGNAAINSLESAVVRSCDVQNNKCADAANASRNEGDLTVSNCNQQQGRCIANARA